MRCAAVVLTSLLLAACQSGEERAAERRQEQVDSLVEATRSRPVVPLEYEDVRVGPLFGSPDSLPDAPDRQVPP